MRVAVVGVLASSMVAFRGQMLAAMVDAGHEVLAIAPEEDEGVRSALAAIGVSYASVRLSRAGLNPFRDLGLVRSLVRAFRDYRAESVLVYAAKPVVYGSIAARLAGVPRRTAMITGVGSALGGGSGLRRRALSLALRALYAVALRQDQLVLFQNPDDERLFRSLRLVGPRQQVVRIAGSGVDLVRFSPTPLPPPPVRFLFVGRLLRDKGIHDFVEAARRVRVTLPSARFQVLGAFDPNPSAISAREAEAWRGEGIVEYLGSTEDVRPFLAAAHVCVLPSYGEGTPRSVLEAMAMGRPVLVTDVPGCRETVEPGRNGLLVRPRDPAALAEAMAWMATRPEDLESMGRRSRELAVSRFDVHEVNRTILGAMGLAPVSGASSARGAPTAAPGSGRT